MQAERLSYAAVAAEVGCSVSNLSRILSGKISLSATLEARLVTSFSVEGTGVESVVALVRGLTAPELKVVLQILQLVRGLRSPSSAG